MNINKARETRVFLPFGRSFPERDWAERILGGVVLPFTRKFNGKLEWFWFIRLYAPHDKDRGNCDFDSLPDKCFNSKGWHRSIKFRFCLNGNSRRAEEFLKERVRKSGCVITDLRDYSAVGDLGSTRFVPKSISRARKIERAKSITNYFHILSRIVLDCLVMKNGRWTVERCPHRYNYFGTIFESLLHLFTIITPVRTTVYTLKKGRNKILAGPMDFLEVSPSGWKVIRQSKIKL